MRNPWREMFFQPQYKGKIAILDDYREDISLGLMMNGIYDLNTTSKSQIDLARQTLQNLAAAVDMQIDNNDYSEVPDGQTWIHHAWSGDMAAAPSYMPKGVPVEVVGYWFPKDGKGPIANDTNTVLRSASSPVLAHLFLNYMLDEPVVVENISFNGYMQPVTADHAGVAGEGADLAAEPDIHGRACRQTSAVASRSFSCQSTPTRCGSRPTSSRATGSSMAHLPPESLERPPGGRAARRTGRESRPFQPNKWFWFLLAAPGMIWLVVLFVVPFYAMLAIGEGKLDRADRVAGRGLPALALELSEPLERLARPVRLGRLRRRHRLADDLVRRGGGAGEPGHRLSGRLLRGQVRRPAQGHLPRAADRAVLDQLHDADAGLDRPAPDQRLHQQGPVLRRARLARLARRALVHGDHGTGLRLHPVPDPGALRGSGPDRSVPDRGRPRPRPRPDAGRSGG